MVLDADALNALAEHPGLVSGLPVPAILTPHPGEMARLVGSTVAEVQADRIELAARQARAWGCVVVLKGARTVVASPDAARAVVAAGNAGMATGGTGDVLAGLAGALLAGGLPAFDAARAAAFAHALAGDLAAARLGRAWAPGWRPGPGARRGVGAMGPLARERERHEARRTTRSARATFALGVRLGELLEPGDAVALVGELGAGKTQLVRGICQGAGVPEREVASPSFAIVATYRGRIPVHHADLYRLADEDELHAHRLLRSRRRGGGAPRGVGGPHPRRAPRRASRDPAGTRRRAGPPRAT